MYNDLFAMYVFFLLYLGGRVKTNAYFGSGTVRILLSNLYCTGTESSLLECNQQSCGVTSCTHSNDAGVICERKYIRYIQQSFKLCL